MAVDCLFTAWPPAPAERTALISSSSSGSTMFSVSLTMSYPASEVGREQPGEGVPEPDRHRAVGDLPISDRSRAGAYHFHVFDHAACETRIENLDGQLEVQPQTPRVHVGRTYLTIVIVDEKKFRVHERTRLIVDAHAPLQQFQQRVARGPVHVDQVVLRRQDDVDLDAAYGGGLQQSHLFTGGQKVGRH